MKQEIIKKIEDILKELGVENPKVNLEPSAHFHLGDYSSSVAMAYAKQLNTKPMDLANLIKDKLGKPERVKDIEVVLPGFINFFFSPEYFIPKSKVDSSVFIGLKFFVEHTQPNPFKTFHIGHLMNNAIGESISRIVKANGAILKTVSYHGDVGLHVAKALWAIKKGHNLNDAYAYGHKEYEENVEAKNEITEINKDIYSKIDFDLNKLYEDFKKESINSFEEIYKRLYSSFDYTFYESYTGDVGKKIILENVGKVFEKGDGDAIIFKGENFEPKTHTRVFLTKDGLPTYETKELGLTVVKNSTFPFDYSLTVTASEQDSFFKVCEVAIGEVFPDLKGKISHISHGMMKLPTGKMSSRTGSVIPATDLIEHVKEKIKEKIKDRKYDVNEVESISEIISIGAIKYSILKQAIGGDIIFDFDKSISFEGDSGPYLQYATVRANSILKKAVVTTPVEIPKDWQTTNLERLIERFGSVLEKSGLELSPHHLLTYLTELAGEFNTFYASHKIIDDKDITSSYRLAITKAFAEVMTRGLDLLAIKVPEKM